MAATAPCNARHDGVAQCGTTVLLLCCAVQVAGLTPIYLSLGEDMLPHLEAVPEQDARRAKVGGQAGLRFT